MRRLIAVVAALYPRSWRKEFGEEFDAVLDDVNPRWHVFANVLGGAITMQMTNGTNWLKLVGAMAVVGAIVAGGASYRVAPHYVSSAVISVTPQPDPVRPTSPRVLQERAAERAALMEAYVLGRSSLSQLIKILDLYKAERQTVPLDDVIARMRHDIRIQARPSTDDGLGPIVFAISFSYPVKGTAQEVVANLSDKFTAENARYNLDQNETYQWFWQDMSAREHTKPAPAPPVGDLIEVLDTAGTPVARDLSCNYSRNLLRGGVVNYMLTEIHSSEGIYGISQNAVAQQWLERSSVHHIPVPSRI